MGTVRALVLLASTALALGCRIPIAYEAKPGKAPKCADGVCAEIVHFTSGDRIVGLWLTTPPETRFVNARFSIDDDPPCGGQVRVAWVRVDRDVHRSGPADVGGAHGLVLGFPIDAWFAHNGYWRDTFVDVELDIAGHVRCVRSRLTRGKDGELAVGQ